MNKEELEKGKRLLIPKGDYCYSGSYICPFWRKDTVHTEEHEDGYCEYLKKSDWDLNEEDGEQTWHRKNGSTFKVPAHEIPTSLIWDQVKMCGVNLEND